MNGYETIYTPASVSKGHNCRPKQALDWTRDLQQPQGTIVCCDTCGQHWFSYNWNSGEGLWTVKWYKVRWFHFKKRRRILGIE